MVAREALVEARRVTRELRARPPRGVPLGFEARLGHAEGVLDKLGVEAPDEMAYENPQEGLRCLLARLEADFALLREYAELVASMESLAAATESTPGRTRQLMRDPLAPATHSGQMREVQLETPSRPEPE